MNHVDNTKQSLIALSLCTGIGGLDNGLERAIATLRNAYRNEGEEWRHAGNDIIQHAAYVEIEAIAAYNLVAKMEQGVLAPAPVWTDLKTFPWEQFYRKIHILTGGYPCQPFSQAGLQAGVSDPRHLFPFIEHGIDAVRPAICFFENVANHLNIGYREVRQRISSLGYKVEADIFAAEQVGAPHLRKRLFIIAVADTYCTEQSKRRGDLAEMLGIPKEQGEPKHGAAISRRDGPSVPDLANRNMGDTDDQWEQQSGGEQREGGGRVTNAGEAMDHTTGRSNESMDDTIKPRLEGYGRHGNPKSRWENAVRSIAATSLWPAGQGREQYPWEESRLESSMGLTVNGYDFTEDLLRMAGNAVVEQQAEVAFRTLIERFIRRSGEKALI
jgi:site-specific DNA-cytosine methylase